MTAPATSHDRPSWPIRYAIYVGSVLAVLLIPATVGGLVGDFFHGVAIILHVDDDEPVLISPTNPPVLP